MSASSLAPPAANGSASQLASSPLELFSIAKAIALGILILITVVGNLFVIAAIKIERNLHSVANYLIVSLAFADLMVACLVMPLGALYEIKSSWSLGAGACDMWTSSDVLCCTASILHLVAIAVDRYWAVTDLNYIQARNPHRIGSLIVAVWVVSLCVSLAPQLGWRDPDYNKRIKEGKCIVSQDPAYQIFATCATFYLPLLFILILYWRIFQAARRRIRRRPGTTIQPSRERRGILRLIRRSPREESTAFAVGRSTPDGSSVSPERSSSQNGANSNQRQLLVSSGTGSNSNPTTTTTTTNDTTVSTVATTTTPITTTTATSTTLTTTTITNMNEKVQITPTVASTFNTTTTTTMTTTTTTAASTKTRTRETIEAQRERKAAKTLAIITGAFVACWLPFFGMTLLEALRAWVPSPTIASIFLWLGYANSAVNPVIYTIFSPEFRQAFKRILGIESARPGR